MGAIGRYIDLLPESARDRVIEAQDWAVGRFVAPDGSRCLVAHAEAWGHLSVPLATGQLKSPDAPALLRELMFGPGSAERIGARFDRLCARAGTRRAVRLCKLRAARGFTPAVDLPDAGEGAAVVA
jgi:hypothetical protein